MTMIDTNAENSILTIDQAASYLAIPKSTLYTWRTRRAGFGPLAVKLGGCLRYRRADLDTWVDEHVETFDDPAVISEPQRRDSSPTTAGVSLSRTSQPRSEE